MSAVGNTASIELLTGLPGSAKSLRFVDLMFKAQAANELVYQCGVNECTVPGVLELKDPRTWQDLPAGSVLFVDEAQDFFPQRKQGDPPPYIKAMSRIRHAGVRLVLGTQKPIFLDTYVRGLVGRHTHLLRENGKKSSRMFVSNEVMEDPTSKRVRKSDSVDRSTYSHDPALFNFYKSAEIHTVKYQMPGKIKKGILFFSAVVVLVGLMLFLLQHHIAAGKVVDAGAGTRPAPLASASASSATKPKFANAAEYMASLKPRLAGQPWSAPAYDNRPLTADPQLLCAISGRGKASTCHCYTEQGTPYREVLTDQQCRLFAHDGVYNPFHVSSNVQSSGLAGGLTKRESMPLGAASDSSHVVGVDTPFGAPPKYGVMHSTKADADPQYVGLGMGDSAN